MARKDGAALSKQRLTPLQILYSLGSDLLCLVVLFLTGLNPVQTVGTHSPFMFKEKFTTYSLWITQCWLGKNLWLHIEASTNNLRPGCKFQKPIMLIGIYRVRVSVQHVSAVKV